MTERPAAELLAVVALRSEYAAVLGCGIRTERCGMGEANANRWASRRHDGVEALAVIGVAGGLDPALTATDVVVATEVRDHHTHTDLPDPAALVNRLLGARLRVHTGPIACSQDLLMSDSERAVLHDTGALCVDMESAAIVRHWAGRTPVTVVRIIVDTRRRGLVHPATVPNGARALWTMRRVARALQTWTG